MKDRSDDPSHHEQTLLHLACFFFWVFCGVLGCLWVLFFVYLCGFLGRGVFVCIVSKFLERLRGLDLIDKAFVSNSPQAFERGSPHR